MKINNPAFILLFASAVFISGCVGQPAGSQENTQTQQTGQQQQAQPQAPAEQGQQEQTQPTQPENQGSTQTGSLKDILAGTVRYTADYTLTTKGETQQMTQVMDAPKYATLMTVQGTESRTIFDGTDFISCTKGDEGWSCFKIAAQKPQSQQVQEQVDNGAQITSDGTCSRAGETGSKWRVTAGGKTSTVCYTSDGILLEMDSEGATMYATKVTRSVDSTMLTPPSEVKDLSGTMPGGIPSGYQ